MNTQYTVKNGMEIFNIDLANIKSIELINNTQISIEYENNEEVITFIDSFEAQQEFKQLIVNWHAVNTNKEFD